MKKISLLLVIILLGAGGVYFLSRTSEVPADTGYADYLPPDTLATISLRDLSGLTDLFPKTALGNFLSKETMSRILADLQVGPKEISDYTEGYDQLFAILHNPGFRMIFGDDVDLALLPVDADLFAGNPQQAMEKSMVLLATTSSSKALQTFARTLLHKDVGEFVSGDLSLTRIQMDEANTVYAYTEGSRLILARNPVAIERCVAAKASGKTLQEKANFIAVKKFWQGLSMTKTYSRGFIQLDRLQPYLLASADKKLQQVGRYLDGMQFFGTAGGRIENSWRIESTNRYTYAVLAPAVKELVDSASKENITLQLLSEAPLLYSWFSSPGSFALLGTQSAKEQEQYKKLDSRLQQELGFSLNTVIQAFGPQKGMVLKNIVYGGMFPLPQMVLFFQVRDHQVAEELLTWVKKKATARGLTGKQQQVGQYTMYSWALLPGEATQPAVVLTRDMLYLANSPTSLRQLLSTEKKRSRLPEPVAEQLGSELAQQLQSANYSALVIWPDRLAEQIKGAADWVTGMYEASGGGSVTVLKDELLVLMQSTKVAVFVSDIFPDHGEGMVTLIQTQEKETAR